MSDGGGLGRIPRSLLLLGLVASVGGSVAAEEAASAPAAVPAPTFELDGNALKLPGPVTFKTGEAAVAPDSKAALDHVKAYLGAKDYITLMRVEVHTDSSGDPEKALELTKQRAMAVSKALVAAGVDCKRLLPVGFGDSKPVASNSTPEGKAQNRRVTFVNATLRGRAIGGMPVDGGGVVAGDPCVP